MLLASFSLVTFIAGARLGATLGNLIIVTSVVLLGLTYFLFNPWSSRRGWLSVQTCVITVFLGLVGYFLFWDNAAADEASRQAALPEIEVTSLNGLTMMPGYFIDSRSTEPLREHLLVIRNRGDFDFKYFVARLQLPEPVLKSTPSFIGSKILSPPGVTVRWVADAVSWAVTGTGGGGASVSTGSTKSEWLLEIDSIPAHSEIQIPFLTMPRNLNGAQPSMGFPIPEFTDVKTRYLLHYLEGQFQIESDGRKTTKTIVMPILYDPQKRAITSLPSIRSFEDWKPVRMDSLL